MLEKDVRFNALTVTWQPYVIRHAGRDIGGLSADQMLENERTKYAPAAERNGGASRRPVAAVSLARVHVMNKFFLPTSRKVLPTFQTFCPDGVHFAQTGIHFSHFQNQARKGVFCCGFGGVLHKYP